MRFLVDTNLPKALATWIANKGHASDHVLTLGLAQAHDGELRRLAAASGAVIVSKDQDFADRARATSQGPCVLWVRTGNGTTHDLLALLGPLWPAIETRLIAGDRLVEIR